MSKDKDKEISTITACLLAFVVTASVLVMIVMICPDKTIPSEGQKPQVQNVKTEVLTHEIRCVEQTSNFCVRYKVFKIIKE